MRKCFVCGGTIQGDLYMLVKSYTGNEDIDMKYYSSTKYFHSACLQQVAGKEYLDERDREDSEADYVKEKFNV